MTDAELPERLDQDRRRLIGAKIKVLANDGSRREATVDDVIFRHGCAFVKLRFADSHFETFEAGYLKTDPPLGLPCTEIRSLQGALDRSEQQSPLSESEANRESNYAPAPNQQSKAKATARSKEWERTVNLVTGLAVAIVIIVGVVHWLGQTWKSDQAERRAERTADVRAVFLHPADHTTGPQVYMNDGTVWALIDIPANVRMIKGDKVRYISESPPLQGLGYPACELKDVTTGYVADAVRLSAPFKHSSCPAQ